jgi:hypothetical protein
VRSGTMAICRSMHSTRRRASQWVSLAGCHAAGSKARDSDASLVAGNFNHAHDAAGRILA